MVKETVLANMRTVITYTDDAHAWSKGAGKFVQDERSYLGEFSGRWNQIFLSTVSKPIVDYFADLGLRDSEQLNIHVTESFPGSWVIDAVIVLQLSGASTYALLKGLSEIPNMVDGLNRLKEKILGPQLDKEINEGVRSALAQTHEQAHPSPPPERAADVDFVLDARPMLSLTPGTFDSHSIHLAVALAEDSLSIENLGDDPLHNLSLGLFVGDAPRQDWSWKDAYRASVPALGARQTLVKSESGFQDNHHRTPDLENNSFVDCWIQDRNGIYLFQFARDEGP